MRTPDEITHGGKTLTEILDLHEKWSLGVKEGARANLSGACLSGAEFRGAYLSGAYLFGADFSGADLSCADLSGTTVFGADFPGADLSDANFSGANLSCANFSGANLSRVDLYNATGDMHRIKTAHFERWPVAWTTAPDGIVTLQIGCQIHPLNKWERGCDRWIAQMDDNALEWWRRFKEPLLALVKASPAEPWGTKE